MKRANFKKVMIIVGKQVGKTLLAKVPEVKKAGMASKTN